MVAEYGTLSINSQLDGPQSASAASLVITSTSSA